MSMRFGDRHGGDRPMKITDVRATPINLPLYAPYRYNSGYQAAMTKTIVEVETSDGIVGLGEDAEGDACHTIELLKPRVIGQDPYDLAGLEWACLPRAGYNLWLAVGSVRRAFGAFEMALWDIRGKVEGKPLYELLGGAYRHDIPFTEYFSIRARKGAHGGETTPLELARYCSQMIEDHEADAFEGKVATVDLHTEIQMVREIRAAIGDERQLRLDANYGWSVSTAREALRLLEVFNVRNLEDPVAGHEEMRRIRPNTSISFSTHDPDIRRAVDFGVPDSIVPNIADLGGIRRTVQFAEACELLGIGFWFHSGDTGIATAGYLHVSAAVESIREPSQSLLRWTADDVIVGGPFLPHGGVVRVPDGPGLGVELDRTALNRLHEAYLADGPFPDHALASVNRV
jgi:glucarate dehydratase